MKECLLCQAQKKSDWLYEDNILWIAKASSTKKWMAVRRKHGLQRVPLHEIAHMIDVITKCFGEDYKVTITHNHIKNHMHWHIRR